MYTYQILDFADLQDWYTHIQRFTTSYAMGLVYGKRAPRAATPECAAFLHVQPQFMNLLEIGTAPPVDLFPILTYVPERWASWKRDVSRIKHLHDDLYGDLLKTVQKRRENGVSIGGLMETAIEHSQQWKLSSEDMLRSAATVSY
jgi:hypothetical protein